MFLGFGDSDVSTDPSREPTGCRLSRHITVATFPDMAHMHNFADTRELLWQVLDDWLPRRGQAGGTPSGMPTRGR